MAVNMPVDRSIYGQYNGCKEHGRALQPGPDKTNAMKGKVGLETAAKRAKAGGCKPSPGGQVRDHPGAAGRTSAEDAGSRPGRLTLRYWVLSGRDREGVAPSGVEPRGTSPRPCVSSTGPRTFLLPCETERGATPTCPAVSRPDESSSLSRGLIPCITQALLAVDGLSWSLSIYKRGRYRAWPDRRTSRSSFLTGA